MRDTTSARTGGGGRQAYGRMWAAVVIAALTEYWQDRQRALRRPGGEGLAESHVARAERYFRSGDGRMVLSMAGIDPTERAIAGLVSMVAGDTSPVTLMAANPVDPEGAPQPVQRQCPVPGCRARMVEPNRSGVCRAHRHAVGFCRCAACRRPPKD